MPKVRIILAIEDVYDLFVGNRKLTAVRFRTSNGAKDAPLSDFVFCNLTFEQDRDSVEMVLYHPDALPLIASQEIPRAEVLTR